MLLCVVVCRVLLLFMVRVADSYSLFDVGCLLFVVRWLRVEYWLLSLRRVVCCCVWCLCLFLSCRLLIV